MTGNNTYDDIPRERRLRVNHTRSYAPNAPVFERGSHTGRQQQGGLDRYTCRLNLGKLWPKLGMLSVEYEVGPEQQSVAERDHPPEERRRGR